MSSSSNIALGTTQALKDKYTVSRNKYKPNKVNVLLIAESPPSSGGYFYSETTIGKDHLFFLIDTCELPVDKLRPRQRRISTIQGASTLPRRVRELDPTRILIVKKTVFKPARQSLVEAGLGDRVLNTKPLPFPSHGNQRKFRTMIRRLVDKDRPRNVD